MKEVNVPSVGGTGKATVVEKGKSSAVGQLGILERKEDSNTTKAEKEETEFSIDIGVLADVRRRHDRFFYPRRILGESTFPEVDHALVNYEICKSIDATISDPLNVDKLPPFSVLQQLEGEMRKSENTGSIAKFPIYGNFDSEGIRILQRFHWLKSLRTEVAFEKTWLKTVFANTRHEKEVTDALLD